jgi:Trypsin
MHPRIVAFAMLVTACHAVREVPEASDDSTLAVLGPSNIACGAVAISPDLAVTASHCVPETVVNYLMAPDGRQRTRPGRGFVVVRDPTNDLALFATSHLVPAELRQKPAELDEVTSMVAHVPKPWGVVAIHPLKVEEGFVRTERLRVGVSGSGLWDSDWRLVGVAIGNDARSGYFASAALIRELVRSVPRDTRGRIQTSREPVVCGNEERPLPNHPEHPGGVNVQNLLEKATQKSHRIDSELIHVESQMGTAPP